MSDEHQDGGGGGGHDGAGSMRWLLTYADLITLLMVFFVVMFAMSRVDAEKYEVLSKSLGKALSGGGFIATIGNEPALPQPEVDQARSNSPPDPLSVASREMQAFVAQRGEEGEVSVYLTKQGLLVSFSGGITFDSGESVLKPEVLPTLTKLAALLKPLPNPVGVIGSTDDVPINTLQFPSNWELSVIRATTVIRYLAEKQKLPPERFVALGYGEFHPAIPNTDADARKRNRRVDVMIYRDNPFVLSDVNKL